MDIQALIRKVEAGGYTPSTQEAHALEEYERPTAHDVALHNAYNADWYDLDAEMTRQCARRRLVAGWLTAGVVVQCEGHMSLVFTTPNDAWGRAREMVMSGACCRAVIVDLQHGKDGPARIYRFDHGWQYVP